jgi:ABC-2 type transport system permease protein
MAIGALIRHPATAAITAIVALTLLPILLPATGQDIVSNAMPLHAWITLAAPTGDSLPHPSTTEAWLALSLWPIAALALAILAVRRQDV